MTDLVSLIKAHANAILSQQGVAMFGIVAGVDPVTHRVKVELGATGVTTNWLPVATQNAGAGWGVLTMPTLGQQCFVVPDSGDHANMVVVGFTHSTQQAPPSVPNAIGAGGTPSTTQAAIVPGETLLVHPTGSVVRVCANGDIYLHPASGLVGIDGTLRCNGDVYDKVGKLDALRQHYDAHTHEYLAGPGPLAATSTTSLPDP